MAVRGVVEIRGQIRSTAFAQGCMGTGGGETSGLAGLTLFPAEINFKATQVMKSSLCCIDISY